MMVDLVSPGLDRGTQFGVLGQNQDRTVVLIVRVEETEFYAVELAAQGWHGEETPLVIVHTANVSERRSNARHTLTVWTTYAERVFSAKQPDRVEVVIREQSAIVAAFVTHHAGIHDGVECTMECGTVTQCDAGCAARRRHRIRVCARR